MDWPIGAFALLLTFASVALGLAVGRWWRLTRGFSLGGVNRALLTVTQGLTLLAILGGLDQRPLARPRLRRADGPCLGPPHRPLSRRRADRALVAALALAFRPAETVANGREASSGSPRSMSIRQR